MEVQGKATPISISRHPEIFDSKCLSDARGIAPHHHQRSPSSSFAGISLSHQAITDELERILSSPEFKRKPSLRGFLHFVVERTLSGCSHQIKGYTVATQVFGRGDDFDNNLDPIVRIQAGRMRRAIERYYRNGGRGNPVRIEIPKGSYVPVFQTTPIEEKLQASFEPRPSPAAFSLAIMPIANLCSDPGQDHLAYGLAQELTVELSHYRDLQVFDCYSTLCWRGKPTSEDLVGKEMKVRFALTGSVRKDKQTIKVILHLIDISTRLQVWGEQYRYKLGVMGMIHLQEDVARRVAKRLQTALGLGEVREDHHLVANKRRRDNHEAYSLADVNF